MKKFLTLLTIAAVMLTVFSCSQEPQQQQQQDQGQNGPEEIEKVDIEILGAGATFPLPLYTAMFEDYHQKYGPMVNYQGIGSGGGIRNLLDKTVDFGGTDAFMSEEDMAQAAGNQILHIPTCLGAIVVTYNLPDNPTLKLTGQVVADIFLGRIKKWNNNQIQNLNPGVELPNMDIVVVHRSDGSGSTFIFSDYLTKIHEDWAEMVGRGKSLEWPTGLGAKGNPGVAGLIQQTPGSIGYVELTYALSNNMPVSHIQNSSSNFIEPTPEAVSAAANVELPNDMRVSLTDTDAPDGYPISGFTWIIVYQEQNYNNRDKVRAEQVAKLMWWMIHEGQSHPQPLHYAPLPEQAVKKAESLLRSMTYNGEAIL